MADHEQSAPAATRFPSVPQADVPKGRDGKHKQIIRQLLAISRSWTPAQP
jgi:hypothetical protein